MPVQELKMERTSISLTSRQCDSLDEMVTQGIYPSVAEAIRAAVGLLEDKHHIYGKPAVVSQVVPVPVIS